MRCAQRENRHNLKWECQEDLFRQDVQNEGDMRLSISLLRSCMADKQTFCAHVEFGALLLTTFYATTYILLSCCNSNRDQQLGSAL